MAEMDYNPFESAQKQFDTVADMLELEPGVRELLRYPQHEVHMRIPVKMDDGSVKVFSAYRCRHNDARGPGKGGIRFHPHETADTVRALSMWMTWKCAVANLPLGGSKGGVVCDPPQMSLAEQERLCRAYVRHAYDVLGPELDVAAPDVMTTGQHMVWMLDEYETIARVRRPGMITGKPVGMGGSLGRTEATGCGVVHCLKSMLDRMGITPESTTASVQGFGNVAEYAVRMYTKLGGKVVAISCWHQKDKTAYTFRKKSGCNPDELAGMKDAFGSIDKEKAQAAGYELLSGEEWLSQDVDIIIPAALENQLTASTFPRISKTVKVICEAANGPTTPDCDPLIRERGLALIPDFLCNAGGVTCSYFEQVQCNTNYFWPQNEVMEKLEQSMVTAFDAVYELAREKGLYMRDAAYVIAIKRVAEAVKRRGWA